MEPEVIRSHPAVDRMKTFAMEAMCVGVDAMEDWRLDAQNQKCCFLRVCHAFQLDEKQLNVEYCSCRGSGVNRRERRKETAPFQISCKYVLDTPFQISCKYVLDGTKL